jgi:hypothetical protein
VVKWVATPGIPVAPPRKKREETKMMTTMKRLGTALCAGVLLAGSLTVAAGAAHVQAGARHAAATQDVPGSLLGTWRSHVVYLSGGYPPAEALTSFNVGGSLVEVDNGTERTALGAWERTGWRTFAITFTKFVPDPQQSGAISLTATITGSLTLSADGTTLQGNSTGTIADLNGVPVSTFSQTFTGTRVHL